jgi:GAF domain-containing protein
MTTLPISASNLQQATLGPTLKLNFLVMTIAVIAAVPSALASQNWLPVIFFGVLTIWALVTAFVPRISYTIRLNGFLLSLLIAGFGEILSPTMGMDAKVIFSGLIIASIIFYGIRTGIITAFLSVFTFAITSGIILVIQIPATASSYNGQVSTWITSSLTFAVLSTFLTGLVAYFSKSLAEYLGKSQVNYREVSKQAKDLDASFQIATKNLKRSERAYDSTDLFTQQFLTDESAEFTLRKAVQFIRDEFDYALVSIYLVDEKNDFAFLSSAAGQISPEALDRGIRIKLSSPGSISYVINHAEYRLSSNVREDQTAYGSDQLLSDTLSQLTLPLIYQNNVFGAIDIQSNQINAFSPLELKVLKTYAGQIVVSFKKASFKEQLEKNRLELDNAFRQFTQQTWNNHLKKGKRNFSIRYSNNILEKEVPQSEAIIRAISQSETVVISDQQPLAVGKPSTSIAIPIRLRGQVIGVLNLKVNSSQLPRDMMPLIESISNRMALALENARLLEDIQAKADREHLVSEISSKIRSSPNVEQVLRTAVSEIGLSLGASDVMIHLHSDQ